MKSASSNQLAIFNDHTFWIIFIAMIALFIALGFGIKSLDAWVFQEHKTQELSTSK
jgi:hypothetical protein